MHWDSTEYRIDSPRWFEPLHERSAKLLADQVVNGLREAIRASRTKGKD